MQPNQVCICLPDGEGVTHSFPGLLIGRNLAFVIFDEHLEIHIVKATSDPNEYEIVRASNPMFYVGQDVKAVLEDLRNLSMIEFAMKYNHNDFVELEG